MSNSSKDEMRTSFDKVKELYGLVNQPKRLVKDGEFQKEFVANGTKYVVCSPEMVFNFDKQIAFKNLDLAFGLCQTTTEVAQRLVDVCNTVIKLMGAKGKDHDDLMKSLVRQSINNVDSLKENVEARYPPAAFICTLFIVRESEDLAEPWTYEKALNKIEDWAKENYSFYDFFCLALSVSSESRATIIENSELT